MGTTTSLKLDLWRRQRRRRKAKREALELSRKVILPRPGGNPATLADTYETQQISDQPLMGVPALKHVPFNTHRPGSIAYALLYHYWLPNSAECK